MSRRRSLALGGVAVLVVAGAGLAAWNLGDHGGTSSAPAPATAATTTTTGGQGPPATQPPGRDASGGIELGVYVKPAPGVGAEATLAQFESTIHRRLAIVQTFTGWQTAAGTPVPFPTGFAAYADTVGATPMVTWQPEQGASAGGSAGGLLSDQPNFALTQLSSGRYDSYIRSWADQAKAFGHVVYVRLMHEMNDRTYPWSNGVNGNMGPQQYIAAWRHIVGIFAAEGATNVQFVWCVGAKPATPDPAVFYPGDNYVSWVSLDGYNRGRPWQSFTSVFAQAYREITAVSTRPVMIAEVGSVENPTDDTAKAGWITSAFEQEIPQDFPRIRAVLYFDAPGRGFSYPLDSSPQALAAFAGVAASPLYQARG